MVNQRARLDYNHLIEIIDKFLHEVCTEDTERDVLAIGMCMNLLTSYLINIAERAIELNDDVLIDLLKNLYILKESGG